MVDQEAFLSEKDLIFEQIPKEWVAGIPLANGDMGVMVWGDEKSLLLTLDKYDIWETRFKLFPNDFTYKNLKTFHDSGDYSRLASIMPRADMSSSEGIYPTRLPIGRVRLSFASSIKAFTARLQIYDGLLKATLVFDNGEIQVFMFIHSQINVLVCEICGSGEIPEYEFCVVPATDYSQEVRQVLLRDWGYVPPVVEYNCSGGHITQKYGEADEYTVAWRKDLLGVKTRYLVNIVTSSSSEKDTVEAAFALLDRIRQQETDLLYESHLPFWQEFWSESMINIPDDRLEALFYIEMYKLACCSRQGKFATTLQGPWTEDGGMPPWKGDYHIDMNVQETYWPIYTSNHLECGEPLYRMFTDNLPMALELGRQFYEADVPLWWCELGPGAEPIYGWIPNDISPGNGAWIAHHFWLHYRYSMDKEFLQEIAFPFMKACMDTYLHIIEEGSDGRLHIPCTASPEYFGDSLDAWNDDTTYDLILAKWLATALIEAIEELGICEPRIADYEKVAQHMVKPSIAPDGSLMLSADQELEHSHRHHSHLIGIYPLGMYGAGASHDDLKAAHASIRTLVFRGVGDWTGWSFPWASMIAGRMGYKEMAMKFLKDYVDTFIEDNTLHVNGDYKLRGVCHYSYKPMTLEGGFAAAAAILELLLQSDGGLLQVFPGVPTCWRDASFWHLRAEGAFLVSAGLRNGHIEYVEVESEQGGECSVVDPFGGNGVVYQRIGNEWIPVDEVAKTEVRLGKLRSTPRSDSPYNYSPKDSDIHWKLAWKTRVGATYMLLPSGVDPENVKVKDLSSFQQYNRANVFGIKQA